MTTKWFNVSYQSVKDVISYGFVFLGFMILVDIFEDFFLNFQLKNLTEPPPSVVSITVLIFISYALIYFVGVIIMGLINWAYNTYLKREKYYGNLTNYRLKISLTNEQYDKIKDNKLFFSKVPKHIKNMKSEFGYTEVERWAEKIMEKEIKNLKEAGKNEDKKRIC